MPSSRRPSVLLRPALHLLCYAMAMILSAGAAGAVSVSILDVRSSAGPGGLAVGDMFTLDIGLANAAGPVYAVGISIYGYERDVLELVEVSKATSFLNHSDPAAGPGGGFSNSAHQDDYSHLPVDIEKLILAQVEPRVRLFQGISISPTGGDGATDRGITGGLTGDGDPHARVTFRLLAARATTLSIGTDLQQDAVLLGATLLAPAQGTTFDVSPGVGAGGQWILNPEPGTALLLGLGLGVLAGWRRQR